MPPNSILNWMKESDYLILMHQHKCFCSLGSKGLYSRSTVRRKLRLDNLEGKLLLEPGPSSCLNGSSSLSRPTNSFTNDQWLFHVCLQIRFYCWLISYFLEKTTHKKLPSPLSGFGYQGCFGGFYREEEAGGFASHEPMKLHKLP